MSDYPYADSIAADPTNYRSTSERVIRRVVIHITDGREHAQPVARMWQEPNHGSSAHYVVGQAGEVIQAVRHRDIAWHAHAANSDSIGIEHSARSPGELSRGDPGLQVSEEQYRASARLVAWICRLHGIPIDRHHIAGHSEVDPRTSHDDCPNRIWDWTRYMELLTEAAALSRP